MLEDLHGQWYFRAVRSGSHRPAAFFAQGETKLRVFRLNVQDSVWGAAAELRLFQVSLTVFFAQPLL